MFLYSRIPPGSGQMPSWRSSSAVATSWGRDSSATTQIRENDNRGDFIALVADESARAATVAMEGAAAAVRLPSISLFLTAAQTRSPLYGDLQRSDHAPFWAAGYPAIQITDTAEFRNAHYHCRSGQDTVDTLDPGFLRQVVQATVGSVASTLGLRP